MLGYSITLLLYDSTTLRLSNSTILILSYSTTLLLYSTTPLLLHYSPIRLLDYSNISCIDDNVNIVRLGSIASIKSVIRRGAASQILEVSRGWSLATLRLGLDLVQASSKLAIGLSLARP